MFLTITFYVIVCKLFILHHIIKRSMDSVYLNVITYAHRIRLVIKKHAM